MTERDQHANVILGKRYPEALIGDVEQYSGPLNGPRNPMDYILTERGWEPLTSIPTIMAANAKREARARLTIEGILAALDERTRIAVIRRLLEGEASDDRA